MKAMPGLPDDCARLWTHLSPVSPADLRLSPVLPGTTFFNGDNGLREFFHLSPVSPAKNSHTLKETSERPMWRVPPDTLTHG